MADISRNSLFETQNSLVDIRSLGPIPQPAPRHYVSLRLQQGVPVLDADWNEKEDIRRLELEAVLAKAIGTGVPAGSDGFRIYQAEMPNDFLIEAGLLFLDGWLVWTPTTVRYSLQPHRVSPMLAPALPLPLPAAPVARRELVYLDAWERIVNHIEDEHLVDPHIGIETCVRVEREWVVRSAVILATDDVHDPATIPNRQPQHRYYPLAQIDRPVGNTVTDAMITDLRRTHLTLSSLTHAPLLINDAARGQSLDSARLADAFRGNLDALRDIFQLRPEIFIYVGNEIETWQAMTTLQDVRATATTFEQQARAEQLHRQAAMLAMQRFFDVQSIMTERLLAFVTDGVAGSVTDDFLEIYRRCLLGTVAGDPQPLAVALGAGDLLGAVMAQERLNESLALENDTLPEGTVTATLVAVNPVGNVLADTPYQLTIRIESQLVSTQGEEPIRIIASAGIGWALIFQGSVQPDLREHLVTIPNGGSTDVVLFVTAAMAAANTSLLTSVRPQRRQQLVYNHAPVALAIGSEILAGGAALATLTYQGPPTQPGNIVQVPRVVMAGGVALPFSITNIAATPEQYQVAVTAQGDDTGWQAPAQPILPELNLDQSINANINFRIIDQPGATSPLTYRIQLIRVTGGANEPQSSTVFDLTFVLV